MIAVTVLVFKNICVSCTACAVANYCLQEDNDISNVDVLLVAAMIEARVDTLKIQRMQ